jgi:hypothetical protein
MERSFMEFILAREIFLHGKKFMKSHIYIVKSSNLISSFQCSTKLALFRLFLLVFSNHILSIQ